MHLGNFELDIKTLFYKGLANGEDDFSLHLFETLYSLSLQEEIQTGFEIASLYRIQILYLYHPTELFLPGVLPV
jgi:hypothetical protein